MKTAAQHKHSRSHTAGDTQQAPMSMLAWLNLGSSASLLVMVLLLAVFGTALAVINISYKHRMAFYELQQSRGQTNNLDVQWGQLLIEQSTFGLEGRVERRAIDELGMKLPDWSTIKMVRHE